LAFAIEAQLTGPTQEELAGGYLSPFSNATAGHLRSATLRDGNATIDFADLRGLVPNASTSGISSEILSQLFTAAFQFPEVATVELRMEGSCATFWTDWLEQKCQAARTRADWEASIVVRQS
jgi:spore germination protein GerM